LGLLHYEQNNLNSAQEKFLEGIDAAKPWGFWEALLPAHVGLARIRYAQGDVEGSFKVIDELEVLGQNDPGSVGPIVKSSRALLWTLEGILDAAWGWAQTIGLDSDSEISYLQESDFILLARILIASKSWNDADRLIDRLMITIETGERYWRLIELLVLRALLLESQGKEQEALDDIQRALELAKPNGYFRIFLDEGAPMVALLQRALSHEIAPEYVHSLLTTFRDEIKDEQRMPKETTASPVKTPSSLVEALSDRELEVLRLLRSELSGPEIARELTIALSTVRTHTQSIYSKLGVSNRRAAVRKAEDLHLI
jgi:LuxR family maltose regulon positive regulatory protein